MVNATYPCPKKTLVCLGLVLWAGIEHPPQCPGQSELLAGLAYYLAIPKSAPVTDNTWGGISDSGLMERCRGEISAQTYAREPDLRFPTPQQAANQFSASPDGKRWDGWAERPDGTRLDFSCNFTAATGNVNAELIQKEP